ncbi:hypothetical protein [Solicola gregarius]|uniref:Ferritin-like domain-containing protein n=1 Tax=Solicola gregarius TaxID=2908642 RepID=A0AA46TH95_9ACTN|nr:hypothetical protein [Solicola gregarius]UYM04478.1 hypothetical protein L0C25_18350 [Solicola gregarius]
MTARVSRRLSRRAFLTVGGLAAATLAAGCGAVDDLLDDDSGSPSPEQSKSADDRLIASALADQERLLARCLAVRAAHHSLRTTLAPIADHHRVHVEILGGDPTKRRARIKVPSSEPKALAALRDLEDAARTRRTSDANRAASGEFARVLAAIAASEAQHVQVLDQAIGGGS